MLATLAGPAWDVNAFPHRAMRRSPAQNTHWDQPLFLIFDSETMPEWFWMPDDADPPSTFGIEYVRTRKRPAAQ